MVQAKQSSIFSRKIVNLFCAMAHGDPMMPRVLFDGGYKLHSIEKTFTVRQGKKVNAELIFCSDSDQHSLVIDAKSGANLSRDQLQRYADITQKSLLDSAFTSKHSAKNHNVLIIGQLEFETRLKLGSSQVPSAARVTALVIEETRQSGLLDFMSDRSGIRKAENDFATVRLNDAFSPLLPVDWDLVPTNYLPVDHEAEDWEFAERLIPELIVHILRGSKTVDINTLGEAVIGTWGNFVSQYKKTMVSRIQKVIKRAAQTRFSQFITYSEKGKSKSFVQLTVSNGSKNNATALRSQLFRQSRKFLNDLQSPQIAILYED